MAPPTPNCIDRRRDDGTFEVLAEQMSGLGKSFLGEMDYKTDFVRVVGNDGHYGYIRPHEPETMHTVILCGQIMSSAHGTNLTAKGTFNASNKTINDDTNVKNVAVLGCPTFADSPVMDHFYRQIATLNEVRIDDEEQEQQNGQKVWVNEWVRASTGNKRDVSDQIAVTIEYKYSSPYEKGSDAVSTAAPSRLTKGSLRPVAPSAGPSTVGGGGVAAESRVGPPSGAVIPVSDDQLRMGATYDPRLLLDYGGKVFNHRRARLTQHDFRKMDGSLIAPWAWHDHLREGTLVLVQASMHCWVFGQPDGSIRKTYQLRAKTLRVISESDLPMVIPSRPDAAPAPIARTATDAFMNFDISPRKKMKLASAVADTRDEMDVEGVEHQLGGPASTASTLAVTAEGSGDVADRKGKKKSRS